MIQERAVTDGEPVVAQGPGTGPGADGAARLALRLRGGGAFRVRVTRAATRAGAVHVCVDDRTLSRLRVGECSPTGQSIALGGVRTGVAVVVVEARPG